MFKSPSDATNHYHEHFHTFVSLALDDEGGCIAAERKVKRDSFRKGLLVRYANPFASDAAPELLHDAAKPFQAVAVASDGAVHAVDADARHHLQIAGKWKARPICDKSASGYFHGVRAGKDGLFFHAARSVWWQTGDTYAGHEPSARSQRKAEPEGSVFRWLPKWCNIETAVRA